MERCVITAEAYERVVRRIFLSTVDSLRLTEFVKKRE